MSTSTTCGEEMGGGREIYYKNYESFIPILMQNEFKSSHELIFWQKKGRWLNMVY